MGQIGFYLLAVYPNLPLGYLYHITSFSPFLKGKLSSLFSLFSCGKFHMFFSIPVTLLWTLSCFGAGFLWTWEYWVTSPAYVIPNVNASTYIINCLYFTHYSLSCFFRILTSCLTHKLELCSASKWSLSRPQWHSAAFPKPLQVIESPVRHMSTSIFFSPSACNTLSEQTWTLPDTMSPIHLVGLGASEVSHSLFRIWLILYSLQI